MDIKAILTKLAINWESIDDAAAAADKPAGQGIAIYREFCVAISLKCFDDVGLAALWGIQGSSTRAEGELRDAVHHGPSVVVVVPGKHQGNIVIFE